MKKRVIVLLVMAFCCAPAAWGASPIKFGVKAGIQGQSSKMSLKDFTNLQQLSSGGKLGFQFGAMARISLPVIYFQPEIVYGVSRFEMNAANNLSTPYNLRTLDVPVLVGAKILFARVFAGPDFNLLTETRVKNVTGGLDDFTTKMRRAAVGFQLGVGVEFWGLNIDVRYVGQFKKPVQEITFNQTLQEVKTGINAWQINLGYLF